MEAAAASFSMVIDSMSFGLRNVVDDALLSPVFDIERKSLAITGIPSTTQSGSLPALIDDVPRTRMVEVEPGCPEPDVIDTPAIFPESILSTDVAGTWANCSFLTDVTEPVFASLRTVP